MLDFSPGHRSTDWPNVAIPAVAAGVHAIWEGEELLAELCFKKAATVRPQTTDRYGNTVARIECDGTDATVEQVRSGMAWVFDMYATDPSMYVVQT